MPASDSALKIIEESKVFRNVRLEALDKVPGSQILYQTQPETFKNVFLYLKFVDEEQRAIINSVSDATRHNDYDPSPQSIVSVSNGLVFNFVRTEGMVVVDDRFVRETVGSTRIYPENPYVRQSAAAGAEKLRGWYFDLESPVDSNYKDGFIGFDPATHNYAHFWGVFFQRVALANTVLRNTPFFFPDMPNYSEFNPGSLRNELMYRISELMPLKNGNYYVPLPSGKFHFADLKLVQHRPNRWDLMFYPEIGAEFDRLSEEARRRYDISYGKPLPKKIYVSRRGATRRRILNEDMTSNLLKDHGFQEIQTEKLDIWDQMAFFAAADVVVSPHGAGCANIFFCKKGTKFVEIYPNPLPSFNFVNAAIARQLFYRPVSAKSVNREKDMVVDLDTLQWALRN